MNRSIEFFERQFRQQVAIPVAYELNAFERQALPWLHGEVLRFSAPIARKPLRAAPVPA